MIAGHRVFTRPDLPVAQQATSRVDVRRAARRRRPRRQSAAARPGRRVRDALASGPTAASSCAASPPRSRSHLALAVEHRPLAPGLAVRARARPALSDRAGPDDARQRSRAVRRGGRRGRRPAVPRAHADDAAPKSASCCARPRRSLGDRPWGVGILGFVPPEIREPQLAVIREIAPPIALIAGGRPSQATPLEAQGTATYLHVPSPGLLDLFLQATARAGSCSKAASAAATSARAPASRCGSSRSRACSRDPDAGELRRAVRRRHPRRALGRDGRRDGRTARRARRRRSAC